MKSIKLRVALYIVTFLVTGVLTYIFAISDITHETATYSLNSAGLPVVNMLTDNHTSYNYLHGYTGEMDLTALRSVITPVTEERELSLQVNQYDCALEGISYEVRDLTGEELIEKTEVEDYTANNGIIYLNIKFRNLLTKDQEYMLIVKLQTEDYGTVSYYSRLVMMDDPQVDEKLDYVKWFSNCTRSEEGLSSISSRLDEKKTADNTNLGFVNLNCKVSQVGYSDLTPTLTSQLYPALNEIDGNLASITLYYTLETNENSYHADYNVWEYFRINRVSDDLTYVNSYDRYMDQIYDGTKGVTTSGIISMGISAQDELESICSPNGYLSAYVKNRNLWVYNAGKGTITEAFTYEDENSDNFREYYNEYDIKILKLTDEGEMDFAVYGYMNRGIHEGTSGICIYHYSQAKETVTELAFLQSEYPMEMLREDIEKISYMNDNGFLYFYRNHTIYYVDCNTGECMLVDSDVNPNSCLQQDNILMYQTGDNLYQSDAIYVLDMEEGNTQTISADSGTYIRALGYIDENLVYGICDSAMESRNSDGVEFYPMYSVTLVDQELKLVKDYSPNGIYVTDVEFTKSKLIFTRIKKDDETGNYVQTSEDEILSNERQSDYEVKYTALTDELYETVYHLVPPVASYTDAPIRSVKYVVPSDTEINVSATTERTDKTYKVYGDGKLVMATDDLALAVNTAQNTGGVVCDEEGAMIWCRYKQTTYEITLPEDSLVIAETDEDSAYAAIDTMLAMAGYEGSVRDTKKADNTWAEAISAITGKTYDLLGNTIELSEYFTNVNSIPLVVRMADGYGLLISYDKTGASVRNMVTGETRYYYSADLNNEIAQYGSVILTVPKAE